VNRYIKDERLRQVFSFHPLLVGGNPFQTTSIYTLIHTLEQRWGVWFAMGGTGAVVRALAALFAELGGELRLSTAATEIVVDERRRRATGVRLATGETLPADAVVSNADVAYTYLRLVTPRVRRWNSDRRLRRLRYSMSLFVVYFGTNRRYEQVAHHEILMGPRYRGLLDDIFVHRRLASDFSLYLHRPTATDASLAPAGSDAFYVLSPVPHLGGDVDWEREAPRYRRLALDRLRGLGITDIEDRIRYERMVTPQGWRDDFAVGYGATFNLAHDFGQMLSFRPRNRFQGLEGVYLVGGGTHPGSGLPVIYEGARISSALLAQDLGLAPIGTGLEGIAEPRGAAPSLAPAEPSLALGGAD
jgi:phytoene desaturase